MGIFVVLCAIPALVAFVGSLVIFGGGKKRNKTQRLLAVTLFDLAIGMCYTFVYQIPALQNTYFLDWIMTTASMLAVPLYYLYLCHLTDTGSPMSRSGLFLPAIIVSVLNLIFYMMMGDAGAQEYFRQVTTTGTLGEDPSSLWVAKRVVGSYIYRLVILLPAVMVVSISYNRMKIYHRALEDYHANADERFFKADNMIIMGYIALMVAVLLYSAMPYSQYVSHPLYLLVLSMAISAAVIIIIFYCLQQHETAEELKSLQPYKPGADVQQTRTELLKRLDNLAETDICCDPQLTISSLASHLQTDPEMLGDLIGKRYGMSFSNYVNGIRIKKAIAMMRTMSTGTPLTHVARKIGYQTYASFAKNFEMFAHSTPSEWMRKYR